MKKKILITTTILSIAVAGVVSAASVWGTYKGNDIIRLTVGGSPVAVTDVPAINYQSRTMIPIYLLKQAGINYTWDQYSKTVDIITQQQNNNNTSEADIQKIKGYFIVSDMYKRTETLGDIIYSLTSTFSNAFNSIIDNNNIVTINSANDTLNNAINSYNKQLEYVNRTSNDLKQYGIYVDLSSIMNSYYNSLDYYKASINGLSDYYYSNNSYDFSKYINNSKSGLDTAFKGKTESSTGYQKYRDMIFNY